MYSINGLGADDCICSCEKTVTKKKMFVSKTPGTNATPINVVRQKQTCSNNQSAQVGKKLNYNCDEIVAKLNAQINAKGAM
jgi:hypothetical protein